jgi:hypothetical protein
MKIVFLITLLSVSYINIRYTDLIASFILISISAFQARKHLGLPLQTKTLIYSILFLFLVLFSTFLAWQNRDLFVFHQFIRGFIPLLMVLFQMSLLSNSFLAERIFNSILFNSFITAIKNLFCFLAAAYLAGILLSLPLMPGIYVSNSLRVFPPLSSILIPISLVALISKKYSLLLACLVLAIAFQSRSNITAFVPSILLLAFSNPSNLFSIRKLSFTKQSFFLVLSIILLASFSYLIVGDRFQLLLEEGDTTRKIAGELALSGIKDTVQLFIGIGIGVPHSQGFYLDSAMIAGNVDSLSTLGETFQRLFENSKYDIESLFTYIRVRHGLVGAVILALTLLSSFRTRLGFLLFSIYFIINGFGSSLLNTVASPVFMSLYMYIDWLNYNSRIDSPAKNLYE